MGRRAALIPTRCFELVHKQGQWAKTGLTHARLTPAPSHVHTHATTKTKNWSLTHDASCTICKQKKSTNIKHQAMTEALDAARSAYSKWYTIQSRVAVLANAFLILAQPVKLSTVSRRA